MADKNPSQTNINDIVARTNTLKITRIHSSETLLHMIDDIRGNVEHLQDENKRKSEKIKEYESKDYENNRIKELIEENKLLEEKLIEARQLNMFSLSKEEISSIAQWQESHNAQKHKDGYFGAIGGELTYKFIPTSIGMIGTVTCVCGEEFTFRDL